MTENWDDLRIFLAVARGESLSAAARLLRMDPATVGRVSRGWNGGWGIRSSASRRRATR